MKTTDFDLYKDLLKKKSGLVLTPDKSYLLESRLTPVAKKWGFENLEAMSAKLIGVPDPKLVVDIVEAMTTNETSFFRDTKPFDIFKGTVLPFVAKNNISQRKLRIWCAAASSGQEPYTISMILKEEAAKLPGWNIEILATDISHDILTIAKAGVYSQFEVQRGLPIQYLMKYFVQKEEKWAIKDEVKSIIKYDYFNLLNPLTPLGTFDVIFCRNVLIYFDEATKRMILDNMSKQLHNNGFLFLGGAETVLGITDKFKPVPEKRGLYALNGSQHLTAAA